MPNSKTTILINARLLAILSMGFASGLPLALTGSTLQAWFTEANISLVTIGALTLLGIPYTLKFIWAPLMDQFLLPKLGKRRGWVLIAQAGLVITLLILANMQPSTQAWWMGIVALSIAFFSASQDIAVDAYRTDMLPVEERGLGAAYYIFAYRMALLLASGLSLVLADYIGWRATYEMMALLMLFSMLGTFFAPKPIEATPAANVLITIKQAFYDLLNREKIILLLLFIVFYKFGDAMALSLMTNFLLHGLGFTLIEVGLAYKSVSIIATILGAFIGGLILTRCHIYWSLLVFGLLQAISNFLFVLLAMIGKNFSFMVFSLFTENFCSGLSTAAFLAFLMSLCNRKFTATQYALFSAIAALGRVFVGPIAGILVENLGWVQFYTWAFLLSFPGIFILFLLRNRVLSHAHVVLD